jgi:hypothetical protein
MSKFFTEFFILYRQLLQKILHIKSAEEIEIKQFDTVVKHCCPLAKELFFLCAKVLLTSLLLIIMYLTLKELNFLDSENSFDLNTLMLYIFVLLTPGILEILFFESNSDKVERMHNELERLLRQLQDTSQSILVNEDINRELKCCNVLCICCCGCLESSCHENGHCKYCNTIEEVEDEERRTFITKHFTLFDKERHWVEYDMIDGNSQEV